MDHPPSPPDDRSPARSPVGAAENGSESVTATAARRLFKESNTFRDLAYTTLLRLSNLERIARVGDYNSRFVAEALFGHFSKKDMHDVAYFVREVERFVPDILTREGSLLGRLNAEDNDSRSISTATGRPFMYSPCHREAIELLLIRLEVLKSISEEDSSQILEHVRYITAKDRGLVQGQGAGCGCLECAAKEDARNHSRNNDLTKEDEDQALPDTKDPSKLSPTQTVLPQQHCSTPPNHSPEEEAPTPSRGKGPGVCPRYELVSVLAWLFNEHRLCESDCEDIFDRIVMATSTDSGHECGCSKCKEARAADEGRTTSQYTHRGPMAWPRDDGEGPALDPDNIPTTESAEPQEKSFDATSSSAATRVQQQVTKDCVQSGERRELVVESTTDGDTRLVQCPDTATRLYILALGGLIAALLAVYVLNAL